MSRRCADKAGTYAKLTLTVTTNLAFSHTDKTELGNDMEDSKRDQKPKRRPDPVKNLLSTYLQKRNYPPISHSATPISQQISFCLVENELSRPNSILYNGYNDPAVIDQNFSKFQQWAKDLAHREKDCSDVELLVAPLFCHLYLDILKGSHGDCATNFLKNHVGNIERSKCDEFIWELLCLFNSEGDASAFVEQFRANKYVLELSEKTTAMLKKFVQENCHVVFLHTFQTWFNLQQSEEKSDRTEEQNGVFREESSKFDAVIQELDKEPKQIFTVHIASTKETTTTALIKRSCNLVVFNQENVTHLKALHPYDPIMTFADCKEIKLSNHSERIYTIQISEDLTKLVTASEDSTLCIYELSEMRLIKQCEGHLGPIYCTTISSNNAFVATGSYDTTGRLWSLDTGQNLRIFVGHSQAIICIDFHPNCLYVATGSSDRNIRMWSVEDGSPLRLFHGCKGVVYSVRFSPTGDVLASASDEKKVRVWDILTSKIATEYKHKCEPVTRLMWSDDGKQLCGASIDGVVRVWDVEGDGKNQEASVCISVGGRILGLEYDFESFGCAVGS